MKIFQLFILCVLLITDISPQNKNENISLLKKNYNSLKTTEDKIEYYKKLASYYQRIKPDSTIYFASKAIELIKETKFDKLKADLFYSIGLAYNIQSNYEKAIENYKSSLALREKIKDNVGIGECYYRFGIINSILGNYKEALDYCIKAVDILEKENDKIALGYAYNYFAIVYYIIGDLKKAEEQMLKTLDYCSKVNNPLVYALAYEHLAILFIKKEDYKKATEYVNKSLQLRISNDDFAGIAGSYENLAIINRLKKNYSKAFEYYNKSIKIKSSTNSKRGLASSYLGIGLTYFNMGNYQKAIEFMNKSLMMRKELKDKRGITITYSQLSNVYSSMDNYKQALEYLKLSKSYSDSLINERNLKNIAEIKEKYEAQKKENQIAVLKFENEFFRTRTNYFLAIMFLLVGVLVLAYFAYRSKRKLNLLLTQQRDSVLIQKEELEKLNKTLNELIQSKEKIFSIIAHDLKSPFHGLLGASEILEKDFDSLSDQEKFKFIKSIRDLISSNYKLVENLLDWSRLKSGSLTFNPEEVNLYMELYNTISLLKPVANSKNIEIKYEIDNSINIALDKNMISTVLRNFISNAIKFTKPGGTIIVKSKEFEDKVEISIIDNGVGIEPEIINKLFTFDKNITRKGTANEKGTGLGLPLCKEMIEKHQGEIKVSSELGKGSIFTFTIKKFIYKPEPA